MLRTISSAVLVFIFSCDPNSLVETASFGQLTANPCTAVALTTPVQGFTATVGQPITLSASATCPSGVTPEFEFWMKAPADSNWNTTALGGYLPAGTSFTPSIAAGLCFSVAVRALGSTDSFQARSSGACGTVTIGTQAAQTRMVPLPGGLQDAHATGFSIVLPSAQVTLVVPIGGRVGESIKSLRVRVQDNSLGHTTMAVALVSTSDSNTSFNFIAVSEPSNGSGADQTLGVTFPAIQFQTSTQYFGVVADTTGNAPTLVYRMEADFL